MNKEINSEKLAKYLTASSDLSNEEREEILLQLKEDSEIRQRLGIASSRKNLPASKQRLLNRISNDHEPGKNHSRSLNDLVSHKRHKYSPVYLFARIAAVLMILVSLIFLMTFFFYGNQGHIKSDNVEIMESLTTQKGQRVRKMLSDGSEIVLGVDSRLEYPQGLSGDFREVHLEGEAFFNVSDVENKPFIVHAGGTVTEVLGTAFNIRSYHDDNDISIVVTEGRVSFRSENDSLSNGVVLQEGQLGRINRIDMSRIEVTSDIEIEQFVGWKDGRLVFNDAVFGDIKTYLERWYNIEIGFSDELLKKRRLTGVFRDETLHDVLRIISISMDLEYELDNRHVTFSSP